MAPGLGIGIVIVVGIFVLVGAIITREAATHRFWRRKVEEGDLEMITQLVQGDVQRWRSERPPKGVPAAVWQGVQGVELLEIQRDVIRASTTAEPQFAFVDGTRRQVTSALAEAKRIVALLAERFFYDIAHVRAERVQIDCYSTFHDANGAAVQRCILTVVAQRADAATIDWDGDSPEVIAEQLGARYQQDGRGEALPIEPDGGAPRPSTNGARHQDVFQRPST
jgi:hypothetical protein